MASTSTHASATHNVIRPPSPGVVIPRSSSSSSLTTSLHKEPSLTAPRSSNRRPSIPPAAPPVVGAPHPPSPSLTFSSGSSSVYTVVPDVSHIPALPSPRSAEHVGRPSTVTPPPRPPRGPARSPAAPRSPAMPTDLPTQRQIIRAIEQSKDGGETLDLSRERLERIGDEEVKMFRTRAGKECKGVWRLALSYNSLRDGCLAPSFATLNRLRYLNLKGNQITAVPPPLLDLQALEILDLSKNHITALPKRPGRLAHLKVLSLSDNNIAVLPTYLHSFRNLRVFKVDHNPIVFPPPEVLGPLMVGDHSRSKSSNSSERERKRHDDEMLPWVISMKEWFQSQEEREQLLLSHHQESVAVSSDLPHEDAQLNEQQNGAHAESQTRNDDHGIIAAGDEKAEDDEPNILSDEQPLTSEPLSWNTPGSSPLTMKRVGEPSKAELKPEAQMGGPGPQTSVPHANGEQSPLSVPSGAQSPLVVSHEMQIKSDARPRLNHAQTDNVIETRSTSHSFGQRHRAATISEDALMRPVDPMASAQTPHHDRSVSSSSITPSSFTPPASASTSSSRSGSAGLPKTPQAASVPGHARGASFTTTQRLSGGLMSKKSLPDLRQNHAKIIEERRGEATDELRPLGRGIGLRHSPWQNKRPPARDGGDRSPRTFNRIASDNMLRRGVQDTAIAVVTDISGNGSNQDGPVLDDSRNSYFRRLSMLPASTISKAVSPALLAFVDAIRGLLFALTELHTALRRYLNFAVGDRVAGVFARVLEPSGGYIANLINALDRFDSMSRRKTPPVNVVRDVIDSAKESITVFGKIVAVLRMQTPAFKDADVRYTRQLLLSIYGSMAEIVCSWKAMAPLMIEIRPILSPDSPRFVIAPPMSKSNSLTGRTPISPIPERSELANSPDRVRFGSTVGQTRVPPVGNSPKGGNRRHAGSFSVQDVERGKVMGSDSPGAPRSDWPRILEYPDGETTRGEQPPPFPLQAEPEPPAAVPHMVTSFSQPARPRHGPASSVSSALSAPMGSNRGNLSFDIRPPTPASATQFDDDLLDVIETATDVAFTVWLKLAEDVGADAAPMPPFAHTKSDSMGSAGSTGSGGMRFAIADSRRPATIPARQHADLVHLLGSAEHVTTTLRESLMGLRANPLGASETTLPDDAQAFVKTVVKVSELIKALSKTHTFGVPVRQCLSQLTQATRECAILMQVSSLRPSAATPAPSVHSIDYGRSGSAFGYSRGAPTPTPAYIGMGGNANGRMTGRHSHNSSAISGMSAMSGLSAVSGSGSGLGIGLGGTSAMSSTEDLSHIHNPMPMTMGLNVSAPQPAANGLRGLHLPQRHPLRGRPSGGGGGAGIAPIPTLGSSTTSPPIEHAVKFGGEPGRARIV